MSPAGSSSGNRRSPKIPICWRARRRKEAARYRRRRRWRIFGVLLLGFLIGVAALFAVAVLIATNS